jgi:uncharacterized protein with FMN-binding domain
MSRDKKKQKTGRVGSGLVTLGAAAVMTIYSTGYLRTRSAAQRAEAAERPRVVIPAPAEVVAAVPAPVLTPQAIPPAKPKKASVAANRPSPAAPASNVDAHAAPPKSAPATEGSHPAPEPSATPTPATPPPQPTASVAAPVAALPATAVLKDGTFSGWGTSRHGDIEATVVIKDGRITSADISQCWTRYSCSVVEHLQGQVVARQSAEVDYVSRATDSANAFYYAVVNALAKAK